MLPGFPRTPCAGINQWHCNDEDYVIVASFFGQLLTKDSTAAKAYVDMNQLLKM